MSEYWHVARCFEVIVNDRGMTFVGGPGKDVAQIDWARVPYLRKWLENRCRERADNNSLPMLEARQSDTKSGLAIARAKPRARKAREAKDVWAVLWTTYDDEGVEAVYTTYEDADAHCERQNAKQCWGNATPEYWVERHTLTAYTLSKNNQPDKYFIGFAEN